MRIFFAEQGRTRVYEEAYLEYVEEVNPRRTQLSGKIAIYKGEPSGAVRGVDLNIVDGKITGKHRCHTLAGF